MNTGWGIADVSASSVDDGHCFGEQGQTLGGLPHLPIGFGQ